MAKHRTKSRTKPTPRDLAPTHALRAGGDKPAAGVALALLAATIGAVYGPAINTPFIFDDVGAVIENNSITTLWPLVGNTSPGPLNPPPELPTSGRPIVNLSFAINHYFGGLNPVGYHAANLLLHYLAAILVWAIMRRTLRLPYFRGEFDRSAGWLALAAALLWALHPLQTEAVIYVTQRTELMMALCYLATLYFSLRYFSVVATASGEMSATSVVGDQAPPRKSLWLTLAVMSCLAGMASKQVMVSAPLIVLLYERTFLAGSLATALRRSWPLYVGLAATWLLLVALNVGAPHRDAAGFSLGVSGYEWWLTQSKVLIMYLKLVVWPSPLLIHYHFPYFTSLADAWMYVVPVFLVGIGTLVLLWRNTPLGFLGTWVFAILSPTFVIPIVTEMAAERRMYLALVPLVVIAVVGGYRLAQAMFRPREADAQSASGLRTSALVVAIPVVVLALAYCLVSSNRLLAYEDETRLWLQVLHYQPADYMAPQSIGTFLERQGDHSAAIDQYRSATQLNPDASLAHYRLAVLLNQRGDHNDAITHFAEAARIIPRSAALRNNLGFAQFMAGRSQEAVNTFRAALELDPNDWTTHKNLGSALQKSGRYQESIDAFQAALRLNPRAIEIYNDLANSYVKMNQHQTAIAMLQQGLELAKAAGDTETARKFEARLEVDR
jgi:tetratricopeptide (TPR) repeat protein